MTVLRYEKVAPVSHDFIEDLIHGLDRVITPDAVMLREVLILSGMPRKTENLRYMSYNRQVETARNRVAIFSAVAVINNRRAQKWQLRARRDAAPETAACRRTPKTQPDRFQHSMDPQYP